MRISLQPPQRSKEEHIPVKKCEPFQSVHLSAVWKDVLGVAIESSFEVYSEGYCCNGPQNSCKEDAEREKNMISFKLFGSIIEV